MIFESCSGLEIRIQVQIDIHVRHHINNPLMRRIFSKVTCQITSNFMSKWKSISNIKLIYPIEFDPSSKKIKSKSKSLLWGERKQNRMCRNPTCTRPFTRSYFHQRLLAYLKNIYFRSLIIKILSQNMKIQVS